MMRLLRSAVAAMLVVAAAWAANPPPAQAAQAALPPGALASNVHIFYYPWYGSPAVNGSYRHWQQGGHTPPQAVGADLYPTLGAYDSGDTRVVDQHMAWIARAGVGVLVYSWWGQGSYEDTLVTRVMDAANRQGVKVAWHLEPYGTRTAASTVADINYINSRYGGHPAFYRDAAHGNRAAFYVFESLRVTDWSPLAQVRAGNIVLAQTTDTTKVAHFGGMYTYDGIAGATAPGWANASAFCKANGLVWAPSIAPGYIDDRAVPGNTTPTLARDNGAAYDRQWNNALGTATGGPPTWVSITSFNEWHEGSVIEPASYTPPAGHGYQTFNGAYGLTGAAAETAYLDRTRYWADRFNPTPGESGTGLRAVANGRFVTAGASPLVASATAFGTAERFDVVDAGGGQVALRARVNGRYVAAEDAGAAPLIANRTAIGSWERFTMIRNSDGTVSFRAAVNSRYVAAENAGAAPLVANRTTIGPWEKFNLVTS
ncbi:alpha-mannosidase [Phytohabitans houttuyneae]|nr:alpha-mannosidase [Phytohabitans houttuyneae]